MMSNLQELIFVNIAKRPLISVVLIFTDLFTNDHLLVNDNDSIWYSVAQTDNSFSSKATIQNLHHIFVLFDALKLAMADNRFMFNIDKHFAHLKDFGT